MTAGGGRQRAIDFKKRGLWPLLAGLISISILMSACEPPAVEPPPDLGLFSLTCDLETDMLGDSLVHDSVPYVSYFKITRLTDEVARSGSVSAVTQPDDPYSSGFKVQGISPGDIYRVSVYMKAAEAKGELVASNDDFWYGGKAVGPVDSLGWQRFEEQVIVPLNAKDSVFTIYGRNRGGGTIYFDDFSIEKIGPQYPDDFAMSPMRIYLSTENKAKLEGLVLEALEAGILVNKEDSWVKAMVFYEGKAMKAKIRLKGDWTDHLQGYKWSFRVKLSADHAWQGMKTFSIQNPESRAYLDEWLAHKMFQDEGVLCPQYGFVPVFLNNMSLGLYAYEEHFEKQLVESQDRREGPILRMSEDHFWETQLKGGSWNMPHEPAAAIEPFKASKLVASDGLYNQFLVAQSLLHDYQFLNSNVHEIFDVERMARYCALSDLSSAFHGLDWHNQRFYYNPVISRLEPIAFDCNESYGNKPMGSPFMEGVFNPDVFSHGWSQHVMIYKLFTDSVFMGQYLHSLERYSEPEYLESVMNDYGAELAHYEGKIQLETPSYAYSPEKLSAKASLIRKKLKGLYPSMYTQHALESISDYKAYDKTYRPSTPPQFVQVYRQSDERLEVHNYYPDSIRIVGLLSEGEFMKPLKEDVGLRSYLGLSADVVTVPLSVEAGDVLVFKVVGQEELLECHIFPWPHPSSYSIRQLAPHMPGELMQRHGDTLKIVRGSYAISETIVIPKGYVLHIEAGANLDFLSASALLSYSPVIIAGTAEEPVHMSSSDSTGYGLTILQAQGLSTIAYLDYDGMDAFRAGRWTLSGALNVYESEIEITELHMSSNRCEDALNIIHSSFTVEHSTFRDIYSDAFDSDFSKGRLSHSLFERVLNDAVDFSGSVVEISDCVMREIGDKGISGGEASSLTVLDCSISAAQIGVASKDRSEVTVHDLKLDDCIYGMVVLKKKPEYGPAQILAEAIDWHDVYQLLLIEKGSHISLDGKRVEGKRTNVAKIFYD